MVTCCHSSNHSLSFVVTRCHSLYHSLSLVVIRCHSLPFVVPLVVPLAVTRWTTRCHSLSLVVIRCPSLYHSLCHSLLLVVTRLYFYKRSKKLVNEIYIKFFLLFKSISRAVTTGCGVVWGVWQPPPCLSFVGKIHTYSTLSASYHILIRLDSIVSFCRHTLSCRQIADENFIQYLLLIAYFLLPATAPYSG